MFLSTSRTVKNMSNRPDAGPRQFAEAEKKTSVVFIKAFKNK